MTAIHAGPQASAPRVRAQGWVSIVVAGWPTSSIVPSVWVPLSPSLTLITPIHDGEADRAASA